MKTKNALIARAAKIAHKVSHIVAAAALSIVVATPGYAQQVSQSPLYLGGGDVPGNLIFVPSVEWPTINSTASIGDYDILRTYIGYFDSDTSATTTPTVETRPTGTSILSPGRPCNICLGSDCGAATS